MIASWFFHSTPVNTLGVIDAVYYPSGLPYKRLIISPTSDLIMLRVISFLSIVLTAGSLVGCAGLTLTPQQRAERQMGVPEYVQVQTRNASRTDPFR